MGCRTVLAVWFAEIIFILQFWQLQYECSKRERERERERERAKNLIPQKNICNFCYNHLCDRLKMVEKK